MKQFLCSVLNVTALKKTVLNIFILSHMLCILWPILLTSIDVFNSFSFEPQVAFNEVASCSFEVTFC